MVFIHLPILRTASRRRSITRASPSRFVPLEGVVAGVADRLAPGQARRVAAVDLPPLFTTTPGRMLRQHLAPDKVPGVPGGGSSPSATPATVQDTGALVAVSTRQVTPPCGW
jgi:hypothetical protein